MRVKPPYKRSLSKCIVYENNVNFLLKATNKANLSVHISKTNYVTTYLHSKQSFYVSYK